MIEPKIRSFWEEDVFIVRECKGEGVVYEVENLARPGDKRVLHRNLLLPCELLEDTPAPMPLPSKPSKPVTRASRSSGPPSPIHQPSDSESDLEMKLVPFPFVMQSAEAPRPVPPQAVVAHPWTAPEVTAPSGRASPVCSPPLSTPMTIPLVMWQIPLVRR